MKPKAKEGSWMLETLNSLIGFCQCEKSYRKFLVSLFSLSLSLSLPLPLSLFFHFPMLLSSIKESGNGSEIGFGSRNQMMLRPEEYMSKPSDLRARVV